MKAKKMLILLGAGVLLSGLFLACETGPARPHTTAGGELVSGTATGSARGYGGEVTVTLTLEEGFITSVVARADHDSPMFAGPVISRANADMPRFNTPRIDSVSGATVTSMAINEAAQDAFDQLMQ